MRNEVKRMDSVEYVCEVIDTMKSTTDWHYVCGIIDALRFADRLSHEEVLTLRGEADKKLSGIMDEVVKEVNE